MGFASGGVDVPTWSFVTRTSVRLGLTELRPPTRPNAKPRALPTSLKKNDTADNLLHKDSKRKNDNEQPTHKTAHLQTTQTNT